MNTRLHRLAAYTNLPAAHIQALADKHPSILEHPDNTATIAIRLLQGGHNPDILRLLHQPLPRDGWVTTGGGPAATTGDSRIHDNIAGLLAWIQDRPHPNAYHLSHLPDLALHVES